jgi:hypothetical protein
MDDVSQKAVKSDERQIDDCEDMRSCAFANWVVEKLGNLSELEPEDVNEGQD